MPDIWCQAGEHYWDRPAQRGRRPASCPEHEPKSVPKSPAVEKKPAAVEKKPEPPAIVKLWCELGEHEWERPRQKGKAPRNCPEHQPAKQEPSMRVSGNATWDYIAKLKEENHCTCDLRPGMTLAELRKVENCKHPHWICNVLNAYRLRLGG